MFTGKDRGIDSTSQNFAKALMRSGLHVFTHRHYPSRIRGGHTYTEIRASADPVKSRGDGYNFLLALGDSFARNPQENAYYGKEELKPLSRTSTNSEKAESSSTTRGCSTTRMSRNRARRGVEENNWHVYDWTSAPWLGTMAARSCVTRPVSARQRRLDISTDEFEKLITQNMSGDMQEANLNVLHDAYEAASELDVDHDIEVPRAPTTWSTSFSRARTPSPSAVRHVVDFISGYTHVSVGPRVLRSCHSIWSSSAASPNGRRRDRGRCAGARCIPRRREGHVRVLRRWLRTDV